MIPKFGGVLLGFVGNMYSVPVPVRGEVVEVGRERVRWLPV